MRRRKKTTYQRVSPRTATMPKPITAAGGVVFKIIPGSQEPQVLLIFRNGYWDLPKGKLEKGESVPQCAVREVAEETGSELPILITDLGTTYHEYEEKGKQWGKTTYWYTMVYAKEQVLSPQNEEGIQKLEWIALSKAYEMVGFDNLRQVLACFKKHF